MSCFKGSLSLSPSLPASYPYGAHSERPTTVRIQWENHIHFPIARKEIGNLELRVQRVDFVNFSTQAHSPSMSTIPCILILTFLEREWNR